MALFRRTSDPIADDYRRSSGERGRLMAQATGPRVELLAFPDHFAVRWNQGRWERIGWHQVHSGGWKQDAGEMHWRLVDGRKERVVLVEEGRFPEVFRERVQASIALEHYVPVPNRERGGVLVTARRDLSPLAMTPLQWTVTATQGARAGDPEVDELARTSLAQLRADYDL